MTLFPPINLRSLIINQSTRLGSWLSISTKHLLIVSHKNTGNLRSLMFQLARFIYDLRDWVLNCYSLKHGEGVFRVVITQPQPCSFASLHQYYFNCIWIFLEFLSKPFLLLLQVSVHGMCLQLDLCHIEVISGWIYLLYHIMIPLFE